MRGTTSKLIVFLVANVVAFWMHGLAFRSPMPILAAITGLVHVFAILFFPYSKFFKTTRKKDEFHSDTHRGEPL